MLVLVVLVVLMVLMLVTLMLVGKIGMVCGVVDAGGVGGSVGWYWYRKMETSMLTSRIGVECGHYFVHPPLTCILLPPSSFPLQIRTATDRSTNSLVGIRLDATLPRLSCNVHSSAYLLLSRLLKNGGYILEAAFVFFPC